MGRELDCVWLFCYFLLNIRLSPDTLYILHQVIYHRGFQECLPYYLTTIGSQSGFSVFALPTNILPRFLLPVVTSPNGAKVLLFPGGQKTNTYGQESLH